MTEQTRERVEELQTNYTEEVWNDGAVDRVDSYFAADAVVHNVPQGEVYDGTEEIKGWVTEVREGFPDLRVEIDETIVDGDRVVSRWTATGTNDGELTAVDVGPTHERVEWSGVTVYTVDGDEITEGRWYYDMLGILAQVGAIPEGMTA